MMISPQLFLSEHETDSYEQLITLRDELIEEIRAFEKQQIPESQWMVRHSPEVYYQMNLQYLSVLCNYIADRYNREFVNCDGDDD